MPGATAKKEAEEKPGRLYALFQYLNRITMITSISQATARGLSTTADTTGQPHCSQRPPGRRRYSFCNRMVNTEQEG